MAIVEQRVPVLAPGDNLTRAEFLRIWDMHPEIKHAELIGGIVYMPSPLSVEHGDSESDVGAWLNYYKAHTPGTASGHNSTCLLLDDSPQPDVNLRLLPAYGGKSYLEEDLLAGVPELLAEVCRSSVVYDLHQKKDLYEEAGVPEYVAVVLSDKEIRWHVLKQGKYRLMKPGADGIFRSRVFPGLWLDGQALFAGDMRKVLAVLQDGLGSAEHRAFVKTLEERRASRRR